MKILDSKSKLQKGRFGKVTFGKGKECLAYCKPIARYNLETKKWTHNVNKENEGKAFSKVIFNREFGKKAGDKNSKYVSFIMLDGTRVENFSADGKRDKVNNVNGWGMSNYLTFLDDMPERIKPVTILVDNDGPLEEQSRLLAEYVNKLKDDENCKKVIVFGQSKCGCMSIAMLKYLQDTNLSKLDVQAYQAPFLGTLLASPLKLYKKIDDMYDSLTEKFLGGFIKTAQQVVFPHKKDRIKVDGVQGKKRLVDIGKNIYWKTLSRSHMDFDVSEVGTNSIPAEYIDRYDPSFLENMFDEQTLQALRKIKVTNITTKCTNKTLTNAMKSLNSYGVALYSASKILFDEDVDGMVPLRSSSYIEKVCRKEGIPLRTTYISDGHHYVTGDSKLVRKILEPMFKEKSKEITME